MVCDAAPARRANRDRPQSPRAARGRWRSELPSSPSTARDRSPRLGSLRTLAADGARRSNDSPPPCLPGSLQTRLRSLPQAIAGRSYQSSWPDPARLARITPVGRRQIPSLTFASMSASSRRASDASQPPPQPHIQPWRSCRLRICRRPSALKRSRKTRVPSARVRVCRDPELIRAPLEDAPQYGRIRLAPATGS